MAKIIKFPPKFQGHDWHELVEYFGIGCGDEAVNLLSLKEHLQDSVSDMGVVDEETVFVLKEFLKALRYASDGVDFATPVWDGLLKVEDDFTFLQFFLVLLDSMWT